MTKETVFMHFSGQATASQKRFLSDWLMEKHHAELYYEWLEEWETLHPQYQPDIKSSFENYRLKVRGSLNLLQPASETEIQNLSPVKKSPRNRYWYSRLAGAAAAFFLVCIVFKDSILNRHYSTGNGEIKTIRLAEGSTVILNSNSDLTVSRFFNYLSKREVRLSGEGLFDVRHTSDNRSFEVSTPDQWKIQVLGTEFNVYARKSGTKIFLNRGSIRLTAKNRLAAPLILRPGDYISEEEGRQFVQSGHHTLQEFGGWKDHVFNFDSTPLCKVARMLEDQFGKKISIPDTALSKRNISGSCRWVTEEDILINLSIMMKFNVIQLNDSIVLK